MKLVTGRVVAKIEDATPPKNGLHAPFLSHSETFQPLKDLLVDFVLHLELKPMASIKFNNLRLLVGRVPPDEGYLTIGDHNVVLFTCDEEYGNVEGGRFCGRQTSVRHTY